jgi:hypothetical protein
MREELALTAVAMATLMPIPLSSSSADSAGAERQDPKASPLLFGRDWAICSSSPVRVAWGARPKDHRRTLSTIPD